MSNKYHFVCKSCGHNIGDFKQWFEAGQKCPKCGKNFVDAKKKRWPITRPPGFTTY